MKNTDKQVEHIGERVRRYRLSKLWTLQQFAAVVGMTASGLWKIENDLTKPTHLTIAKIKRNLPDWEEVRNDRQ